jgi:hypothetical protein
VRRRRATFRDRIVTALLALVVLGAVPASAKAEPRQLLGYVGVLGEWELTATVTEKARLWTKEFSGLLSMKHVGICSQDGPEQKTGEIRFQISAFSSQLDATLLVDGLECTYSARLSEPYSGLMVCPDRAAVPLKLWLR